MVKARAHRDFSLQAARAGGVSSESEASDSEAEETWYGERHLTVIGERLIAAELTYPPSRGVKEYLDALWEAEELRRAAVARAARLKASMRRSLPSDVSALVLDKLRARTQESRRAVLAGVERKRSAALFEKVKIVREVWYNPS